jgi:hypothetical protein
MFDLNVLSGSLVATLPFSSTIIERFVEKLHISLQLNDERQDQQPLLFVVVVPMKREKTSLMEKLLNSK